MHDGELGRGTREGGRASARSVSLLVAFHPLAAQEIVDAQDWYDGQHAGLGDRFLAGVDGAVARALKWPRSGTPVVTARDGVVVIRKLAVGGFPWVVGYEAASATLLVLAVFHQRRRPGYWTSRAM